MTMPVAYGYSSPPDTVASSKKKNQEMDWGFDSLSLFL